ncbi:TetR/AcrR family transcriptional regulator [Cohnella terricola]|uniref:TetR/AcrR family transcriptional regulator n=1 Tax=Cohnella terricola TaxID=1289167 RepID=UPI0016452161|nr:TetR/AcrR family transcriptional regulator [Cohnella terricola]
MQDKKKQVLDAAIRCFARKGFNATSIQEIADELGMAKGSIYFYFKSKDDLLISVLEDYGEMIFDHMRELPAEAGRSPKEKLALQFERQFRFIRDHLDFMRMLLREPLTGLHPRIREMMIRLRARSQLWCASHILAIYGKPVEAYLSDAVALISGLGGQYFEALLFEGRDFDEGRLSRFLTRRLDDLVTGMIESEDKPILPPMDLARLRTIVGVTREVDGEETMLLQKVFDLITASGSEREDAVQSDLIAALSAIEEEIAKPAAEQRFLLRAMLALLRQHMPEHGLESLNQLELKLVLNS